MNIKLRKDHFDIQGIDEFGKFFIVQDSIGFSTENGVRGFNRADAGQSDGEGGTYPIYTDALGNPYPKVSEVVLAFLPYLNLYHDKDIELSEVLTPIEREESLPEPVAGTRVLNDYETEVAYNHKIEISKDGWYTVYAFILPAINIDEGDALPTEGVYFDKRSKLYVDAATTEELELADLLDQTDVESLELQFFVSPRSERKLHDLVGDMADLGLTEGNCSKNYKKARSAVLYCEGQLSGAHVKFNDGYKHRAQQIIEDLENSDPYENC